MDFTKSMGRHVDVPQLVIHRVPAMAAGSGNDAEVVLLAIPNLSLLPGVNKGNLAANRIGIRAIQLIPEANLTGNATHSFSWSVRQWRVGSLVQQVNTMSATTITAGSMAVTPTSMTNISVGQQLTVSGGTGATETVTVTSIVPGVSFTATFANGHSGAYTIQCANLASINYNATSVTETAYTPHQLPDLTNNIALIFNAVLPGDVLTLQRASSDATGLASPAVGIAIEYGSVFNNQFWG